MLSKIEIPEFPWKKVEEGKNGHVNEYVTWGKETNLWLWSRGGPRYHTSPEGHQHVLRTGAQVTKKSGLGSPLPARADSRKSSLRAGFDNIYGMIVAPTWQDVRSYSNVWQGQKGSQGNLTHREFGDDKNGNKPLGQNRWVDNKGDGWHLQPPQK